MISAPHGLFQKELNVSIGCADKSHSAELFRSSRERGEQDITQNEKPEKPEKPEKEEEEIELPRKTHSLSCSSPPTISPTLKKCT